jgi:septal ring factor EnvC (AmiA/AmiB activator)
MIEYTLVRFQEQLQKRLAEIQRQATGLEDLRRQRRQSQESAKRVTDAIAATGHSAALLSKLAEVEARIEDLDRRVEGCNPINVAATVEEIRDFVYRNILNLRGLLHEDASKSKDALARHIGQLVLKPKQTPTGQVYEVSGDLNLLVEDVMPVVARDGIEPRRQPFQGLLPNWPSGLESVDVIEGK